MKKIALLFISGSRVYQTIEDDYYTNANFDDKIWLRYHNYSSDLTVILPLDNNVLLTEEAKHKYNIIDKNNVRLVTLPDLYKPSIEWINIKKRKIIKDIIYKEVSKSDKVIIRSVLNFYTQYAVKCCVALKKPYLIEVTGFAKEGRWHHGVKGKLAAYPTEYAQKNYLKNAPYAVYVTEKALQERYSCLGKTLGCSDVELEPLDDKMLNIKIDANETTSKKIILGTAAYLDVKWKGQRFVIDALAKLKAQGINNIEYHLVGGGTGYDIKKQVKKLNLENEVKILGALPHTKVFSWIDTLDVYIQPSLQEGLCRSLVEAMSRACPILASDCGGNFELQSGDFLFNRGSTDAICDAIKKLLPSEVRKAESIRSFERAKAFEKAKLDKKRDAFYIEFLNDKNTL